MQPLGARSRVWRWTILGVWTVVAVVVSLSRHAPADDASPSPVQQAPVVSGGPLSSPDEAGLPRVPLAQEAPQRSQGMFDDIPMPNPPGALQPSEVPRPSLPAPQTAPVVSSPPTRAAAEPAAEQSAPAPPVPEGSAGGKLRISTGAAASFDPVVINSGVFATTFDDPAPEPSADIDPASFNGVQPGTTTADELVKLWGQGKESSHEGDEVIYSYSATPFPRVDVTVGNAMVRAVVIHLDRPTPPAPLAKQLKLDDVRPASVPDDSGELLGQMFPERGVLFVFAPGGKHVSHVVLDRIDIDSFVVRAESELELRSRHAFSDLGYVLSQQPDHARALWTRAKLMIAHARYDEALKSVEAALATDPKEATFQLTRAEILGLQGKYEEAIQTTKNLADAENIARHVQAKALCQLGDLVAAGPEHDYKLALDHHMAALKAAESLTGEKRPAVRKAAKHVLLDANLGLAHDIASGFWQQKDRVVPQWLDRAKVCAEDLIDNEQADPALRLHVARQALRACAAAEGKVDPLPWTRLALQHGNKLIAAAADPWRKERIEWELGAALSDGLTVDELRSATEHALTNGTLTVTHLEAGAKGRRATPDDAFLVGRVYYRIGSLHAVKRSDHKTAVAWYEKALPLLDRPLPPSHRADQGRYGEWLVSMGISFWETGRQEEALELTDAGAQHVQEAVNRKLIDEKALAIPYNNLASMNQALGRASEAKNFAEMATKLESTTRR